MGMNEQRVEILRRVGNGELTVDEGSILLEALERGQNLPTFDTNPPGANHAAEESQFSTPTTDAPQPEKADQGEVLPKQFLTEAQIKLRKLVWLIPFILGLLITAMGGTWMVQGYQKSGLSWGFWLSWIPFVLGIVMMAVSWNLKRGCWLHVRVHQKTGSRPHNVNISIPLPLGLTAWFFRNFGDRIGSLKDKHIDEMISALEDGITADSPLIVQVDEDDEQVEVWIECS